MNSPKQPRETDTGALASLILRVGVASLFFAAAAGKLKGGAETILGTVQYFEQTFADTWLPLWLVRLHGYLTPFIEAIIPVWLLVGLRLKICWVVTCVFVITLGFGTAVAGRHDTAAANYNYLLICVIGLYLSRYDRYNMGQLLRNRQ
jgi:uncharacterized membrane protein YphA (DoxX/SURF4 family)